MLIRKQKQVHSIFNSKYALAILNRYISEEPIKKIDIKTVKKYVTHKKKSFVASYTFNIKGKKETIFAVAHSDGSNNRASKIIEIANKNGITNQSLYYFDKNTQAVFSSKIDGKSMLYYIQKKKLTPNLLIASAKKIYELHLLKSQIKIPLPKFRLSYKTIDPEKILEEKITKKECYQKKIKLLFEEIKRINKKIPNAKKSFLVHADFHPHNIFIESKNLLTSIIDFTSTSIGHFELDLGIFLQQLEFMSGNIYSQERIWFFQKIFLDAYFKNRGNKMSDYQEKRIMLFQAWSALRSSVYFLVDANYNEKCVIHLISKCEEILQRL